MTQEQEIEAVARGIRAYYEGRGNLEDMPDHMEARDEAECILQELLAIRQPQPVTEQHLTDVEEVNTNLQLTIDTLVQRIQELEAAFRLIEAKIKADAWSLEGGWRTTILEITEHALQPKDAG